MAHPTVQPRCSAGITKQLFQIVREGGHNSVEIIFWWFEKFYKSPRAPNLGSCNQSKSLLDSDYLVNVLTKILKGEECIVCSLSPHIDVFNVIYICDSYNGARRPLFFYRLRNF